MKTDFKFVSINELFLDKRFCLRDEPSDSLLYSSVEKYGIIQPLIGVNVRGEINIIAGFKRFNAAQKLGFSEVPVCVIENCSEKELFLRTVLTAEAAGLNDFDKCLVFKKAVRDFGFDIIDAMESFCEFLLLPKSRRVVEEYLSVFELDEKLTSLLEKNALPFRAVKYLLKFQNDEQAVFADKVMSVCFFSSSEYKFVIETLLLIVKRDSLSLADVLEDSMIKEVFLDKSLSEREKAGVFIDILRKKEKPVYSEMQQIFEAIQNDLNFSKNIKLKESPYFESPFFSLQINFKNIDELFKATGEIEEKESLLARLFSIDQNLTFGK